MIRSAERKLLLVFGVACVLTILGLAKIDVHATTIDVNSLRSTFDATYYYNNNPDVAAAIGNNPDKLFEHYVFCGMAEGRKPSAAVAGTSNSAAGNTNTANAASAGTILGTYTTRYNAKIPRATNVELATAAINGKVLKPGEVFSFTNTVGPRTPERGYVDAPVFVSGTISHGIGGGICQVSSTLYATMITAGIPAIERHAHSLPVSYLPAGMDATVSGTTLDLKFANPYKQPMLITAAAGGGNLTVVLSLK